MALTEKINDIEVHIITLTDNGVFAGTHLGSSVEESGLEAVKCFLSSHNVVYKRVGTTFEPCRLFEQYFSNRRKQRRLVILFHDDKAYPNTMSLVSEFNLFTKQTEEDNITWIISSDSNELADKIMDFGFPHLIFTPREVAAKFDDKDKKSSQYARYLYMLILNLRVGLDSNFNLLNSHLDALKVPFYGESDPNKRPKLYVRNDIDIRKLV